MTVRRLGGFSLLELVIVVVILSVIAAMAVARSGDVASRSREATLTADLARLRAAIDHYAAEHGGAWPDGGQITLQLIQYTDMQGDTSPTKTATHIYGPYLRQVPPNPLGATRGKNAVAHESPIGTEPAAGWWYDETLGVIRANLPDNEVDATGKPYNCY